MIGLLYSLVGINFIFQLLAMLGILPSAGPIPIYIVLVSFGAFVAALAYLIGLAVNWKRLSTRPALSGELMGRGGRWVLGSKANPTLRAVSRQGNQA